MSDQWDIAAQVMPNVRRLLLYGPPGTGKTTIGFSDGSNPYYVGCHEEISVAELVGHFIPVGNRFVWLDGPALAAWRKGKRLIIDEIDQASGAVLSVLRAILNDPGVARLTIPDPALAALSDDELAAAITSGSGLATIHPAEGFSVIATMNGEPEDLDEPLLDRFEAAIEITQPHPDAVKSLPADLRKAAKQTASEQGERRIGIRRWKAFAQLREHVGEEMAGKAVFGPRHGAVVDALKLTRPAGAPESKTPASKVRIIAREAVPTLPFLEPGKTEPTAYWLKTGKRGRPPRATCPLHGKLTHRNAVVDDGALYCRGEHFAGGPLLIAKPGSWSAHVKRGDEWVKLDA